MELLEPGATERLGATPSPRYIAPVVIALSELEVSSATRVRSEQDFEQVGVDQSSPTAVSISTRFAV